MHTAREEMDEDQRDKSEDFGEGTTRITVTLSTALAEYLREQAAYELRSISGMVAFMVEFYRRKHED